MRSGPSIAFGRAEGPRTLSLVSERAYVCHMNGKTEGGLAILAAFLVMLSAMWEPLVSATVAAGVLVLFGVYQITEARRR